MRKGRDMSESDFEEAMRHKKEKWRAAEATEAAERVLRRARLRALNYDPDAYPRTQDTCHHPYFDHKGRCYACGACGKEMK
jgi:hypothetical protein